MRYLFISGLILCLMSLTSCGNEGHNRPVSLPDAQKIIDRAISLHGGELYDQSEIWLTFRDKTYRSLRQGGNYQYERHFDQDGEGYEDVMTSDDFTRKINGEIVAVPDTMVRKYRNSINSVWYFALLPYKLNDPAVRKKYLGVSEIEKHSYHKIEVTFQEEGGGEDFQDVFIYFFGVEDGLMDHLAYSYETDGGGVRFRKGYNFRTVNGMRFADYVNFKGDPNSDIRGIDKAYFEGKLDTLSLIELEDIKVQKGE